jgi:hypothetical protein
VAVTGDQGLQQIFPGAEGALRQELEQFARDISAALATVTRGVEQLWEFVPEVARVDSPVGMGQALRVDSVAASVPVRLPRAVGSEGGRACAIVRLSSANSVILIPPGTALIDGAASATLPATVGMYVLVFDGVNFWRVRG